MSDSDLILFGIVLGAVGVRILQWFARPGKAVRLASGLAESAVDRARKGGRWSAR
ncbi:MAG TPA: hypothetical protein VGI39_18845 [Polyangiaceae bacterium]|jgi:hypothetical protein